MNELHCRAFLHGTEISAAEAMRASNEARVAGMPCILILHGLFGDADNWSSQAKDLSRRGLSIVPDMPNHGRSPEVDVATFDAVAAYLWEHYEALAPLYLIGHSMGGKAAMGMALLRPDAVKALVVVDIAPRPYPPRHADVFGGLSAVTAAGVRTRAEAERVLAEPVKDKMVRLFLLKSFVPGEPYGRWRMNVPYLTEHYEEIGAWPFDRTAQYPGPTIVVRGELSPYVTAADELLIREHFPAAKINTLRDTGHWLHAERREEFLTMVHAFLP